MSNILKKFIPKRFQAYLALITISTSIALTGCGKKINEEEYLEAVLRYEKAEEQIKKVNEELDRLEEKNEQQEKIISNLQNNIEIINGNNYYDAISKDSEIIGDSVLYRITKDGKIGFIDKNKKQIIMQPTYNSIAPFDTIIGIYTLREVWIDGYMGYLDTRNLNEVVNPTITSIENNDTKIGNLTLRKVYKNNYEGYLNIDTLNWAFYPLYTKINFDSPIVIKDREFFYIEFPDFINSDKFREVKECYYVDNNLTQACPIGNYINIVNGKFEVIGYSLPILQVDPEKYMENKLNLDSLENVEDYLRRTTTKSESNTYKAKK